MSGRMLSTKLRTVARRANASNSTRYLHRFQTGGLLQAEGSIRATQSRIWFNRNAFHNAVTVRNASFVRFLPKLVLKFVRIPAMFGGLAIGAFAWVQYQANRMFYPYSSMRRCQLMLSRGWRVCHRYLPFHERGRRRHSLESLRRRERSC